MRFLATIGFLAILAAIAAGVYFFGGYYSISAVQPDPGPVAWAIGQVRDASIGRHATDQPPMSLDDPAVIQAGARAFDQRGCVNCHGGPGVDWAKFSEGLRPDPPDLKDVAKDMPAQQIFWVVKNGINMTGMPSFGRVGAEDKELWSIAAFVKKLPTVSDSDYKSWTAAPSSAPTTPAPAAAPPAQQ
ncbi:MAG TPA: cytochrome c [Stellaceae bacterium]|nr:cytochrome c [Stellaceae bacterium]